MLLAAVQLIALQDYQTKKISGYHGTPQSIYRTCIIILACTIGFRSKTFDEIREENRRKQLEQNYPRPLGQRGRGDEERDRRQSRQQTGTGSAAPVHRNKYGDEVQDD